MTAYTITPEQHAAIVTAQKQLIDLGDTKTAVMLDWVEEADLDEEKLPKPDLRQAFEREFSECDLSRDRWGDYASVRMRFAWLGWTKHAAFAMAEDRADRNHALTYLRQAEQLLTGNEATLHDENQRLRAQLKKES